jgi:threonine/homoserine/homoserine lactone efflux protein
LIAVTGGLAPILFGATTIYGNRTDSLSAALQEIVASPYVAGFLTRAANPYFRIWRLPVGRALLISSLEGGLILAVAFMAGHWGADTAWFTLVSTNVAKGRIALSDTAYHRIMAACGVFHLLLGLYYLADP